MATEKIAQEYDVISIEKKEALSTNIEQLVSKGLTYEDATFLDGVSQKEANHIFHKVGLHLLSVADHSINERHTG